MLRFELRVSLEEREAWRRWIASSSSSSSGKRRKRKKRRKKKTPKASSSRCALLRFPRARAVRTWKSELIPAPCLWQSLHCPRSTGVLDYFWEITSGWMPYSARYLVRQWIQVYVSLRRLLEYFICRARRRHWQWYVLAGFAGYDTPRAVFFDFRGDSTGAVLGQVIALEARGDSTGAVLVKVYMPVVVSGVVGQTVQNTVEIPQSQFWDKVFMPVVVSGAVDQTVQNTRRVSTGAVLGQVFMPAVVSGAFGQTAQNICGVFTGAVLGQVVHARCCVWC